MGARLGDLFYFVSPKRRRIVAINLALVFPQWSEEQRRSLSRQHFRVYVQCLIDYGLIWWGRKSFLKKYIRLRGVEHIVRGQEAGDNIILLTGHYIALDLGGTVVSEQIRLATMAKAVRNKLIDWFLTRARIKFNVTVFLRKKGIRAAVRAIREKYSFYYLPDEDFGPKQRSVFAPFFATEAATLTAVGRLANLTKAKVLPCYIRRLPRNAGYEVVVQAALENFPSGDEQADASLINRVLEEGIRKMPEQYMWTLRLFKSRPGSAPSPYSIK